MPLSGLTSFYSTAKIAPRMHQKSSFSAHPSTPQTPPLMGRGTPPPYTLPPRRLDPRAYGARNSRLRRSVPPAFSVSPPDLGVLAETLVLMHINYPLIRLVTFHRIC